MQTICFVRTGAHLYGTETSASDLDAQHVVVPDARSILLGRSVNSQGGLHSKTPSANDVVTHTLARFVSMILEGQTIAVEILFAPEQFHLSPPHSIFRRLQEARGRLIPKTLAAFVGYCRRQAAAYSIKGDRIRAAEAVRDLLLQAIDQYGQNGRVGNLLIDGLHLPLLTAFPDAVTLDRLPQANGRILDALVVCGRKMPERLALADAHVLISKLLAAYGRRAQAAATANGVDWKALSHAVRIGSQALELLSTGHLTLPRPDATRLRAIKAGQADLNAIRAEIDSLLAQVEAAQATSVLPEQPDRALAEEIVLNAHRNAVLGCL